MRAVAVVAFAVVVLGCAGVGQSPPGPPIKATAEEIAADFRANQAAGRQKWHGKAVEVSGTVKFVTVGNDLGGPGVHLVSKVYSVICRFPVGDERKVAHLEEGQQLTVRGTLEHTGSYITVRDCVIVKAAD